MAIGVTFMAADLSVSAQSAPQASFQVGASITAGCLVNNTPPEAGLNLGILGHLNFGTVSTLTHTVQTASLVASGNVSIRCTPNLALTMRIDGGFNQNAGNRYLKHGAGDAVLRYNLFSDAAYQHIISIDVPVGIDTSSGDEISLPIYGQLTVPAGRPSGVYTDHLTVTLEW